MENKDNQVIITGIHVYDIKWNTTDEERKGLNKDGFFVVTRIHRDDLNNIGFDGDNISDEDMEELANRMNDDYLGQLYWESMEIIAESMGIPRKEEK